MYVDKLTILLYCCNSREKLVPGKYRLYILTFLKNNYTQNIDLTNLTGDFSFYVINYILFHLFKL